MKDYNLIQKNFTVDTYVNRGLTLVRGEGVYLYDEEDTPYLDLMSNYGVNILGYHHPHVTQALHTQLDALTTLHGSFANNVRAMAAQTLVKRLGGGLSHVYFSNSGAEAVEAALKFAVLATGKKQFIVADHNYHGKTLGALSAIASEKYKAPFTPLLWDFPIVPFNDTDTLEKAITDQTAAFIIEPIQGEGGIHVPSPEYLRSVREICTRKGILLIIDEIQTGMGRTGTLLASSPSAISYDIVCLGKGLGGGIPVGATLVSQSISKKIPKHIHTSTFGGNPLAMAGILATLETITEEFLANVIQNGEYFLQGLRSIQSPFIHEIRGKGYMIGIEMTDKRNEVLKKLQEEHILAIPAGDTVIRLLPPLILEKKQIDEFILVLQRILTLSTS